MYRCPVKLMLCQAYVNAWICLNNFFVENFYINLFSLELRGNPDILFICIYIHIYMYMYVFVFLLVE